MNKVKNIKGQAMVEFVLILPVFLLLLLGMADISRVISANFVLENASRSAARVGVISNSDSEIITAIENGTDSLDASSITYTITPTEGTRGSGDELTVEINYTVDILTPIVSNVLGNTIPVSGKTIMRVE
ncbi:MAG TPA: TadE/TadG family type IV pilus assembly protein [Clostridia bacterium]|nr:TadE/TadG family type IV pilus assembly protein [Clostridia bacterium]